MRAFFRHSNWATRGAVISLSVWALLVATVLLAHFAQRREVPDAQMMDWYHDLLEPTRQHKGFQGWDPAAQLEQMFQERERPYTHLAIITPDGQVVASHPSGWDGQNAKEIVIGDSTLWELTRPPEGPPTYAYAHAKTGASFPYSGRYLVGDTLWLGMEQGRFVAVRPAYLLGKPYWRNSWPLLLPALGFTAFLSYWLLTAIAIFLDARRRGERALAWGMIALAANLVGLGAYLLVRGTGPRAPCHSCGRPLQATWNYCPHCGTPPSISADS